MRFISNVRKYGVGIFSRVAEPTAGGGEREVRPGLTAEFQYGQVSAEELELAERHWKKMPGQTYETDEVTKTNIISRLSSYDTEDPRSLTLYREIDQRMVAANAYTPDGLARWQEGTTQRLTESKLTLKAETSDHFFLVAEIPAQAPWPRYDEFPGEAETLVEIIVQQGHNLEAALRYEQQNANRADVVQLLQERAGERREALGVPDPEFVRA